MKQNSSIQMITDYEGDMPNLDVQVDGEIPIFVTRNHLYRAILFHKVLLYLLLACKGTK